MQSAVPMLHPHPHPIHTHGMHPYQLIHQSISPMNHHSTVQIIIIIHQNHCNSNPNNNSYQNRNHNTYDNSNNVSNNKNK